MMRWLVVWRLRRAQRRLQSEIDWLRDTIWTDQTRLAALEVRERAVQAELWCAESPRSLLDPCRPEDGFLYRGGDL
jgi:hypothetical protein